VQWRSGAELIRCEEALKQRAELARIGEAGQLFGREVTAHLQRVFMEELHAARQCRLKCARSGAGWRDHVALVVEMQAAAEVQNDLGAAVERD
jgi:hypothetical protein